eukprot:5267438-Prymnesium_polylepis.1
MRYVCRIYAQKLRGPARQPHPWPAQATGPRMTARIGASNWGSQHPRPRKAVSARARRYADRGDAFAASR